jgi:hypothetical protein
MLALLGGRERSLDDYRALASAARFSIARWTPLPLWSRAAIELTPETERRDPDRAPS